MRKTGCLESSRKNVYIPSDSGHTPYRSQDKGVNHMSRQKEIPDLDTLSREEKMKYEIAGELGLLDRVLEDGWKTLSAKETGRIGGLVTRRKREEKSRQAHSESMKDTTDRMQ